MSTIRRLAASRLLILSLLTLLAFVVPHLSSHNTPSAQAAASATTPCGVTTTAPAKYKHVIWIWFENKTYSGVIGSSSAPYITSLANQCATNTAEKDAGSQYSSLSNYIAATSGQDSCSGGCAGTGVSTFGDCMPPSASCHAPVDNIFRQVRAIGGTAKSFEETMPSNCSLSNSGNYQAKHNPAAYYDSGSDRTACQSDDVPMGTTTSGNLKNALASDTSLPTFSFLTPDMCNDMHDCSVATGDNWAKSWLPIILNSPAYQSGDTAVFITQDEDTPIPNVVLSPSAPHVVISDSTLSHYSDLRTTEDMLGITTHLGNAATTPALPASYNLLGSGGGGGDTTKPTTAITSPAAGATVSGSLAVSATATDNVGVTRVELYVDGTLQPNPDTSSPYSFTVDTTALSAGSHSLTTKAYDAAGNVGTSAAVSVTVQQPSCSVTPNPALGVVNQTVSIPSTGAYRVWSRIKAPDTTNNSYYLQIDGGCPINVGDLSTMPANTWTWVNYQNGSAASIISLNLSSGTHQLVYNGRETGVELDRIIFTADTTCVPTGTGDNCANTDTTPPTVNLTAPAGGTTVSGKTVSLTATASDASGIAKVDFLVDGTLVGTSTTSPYSLTWDSTTVGNASHSITAKATDAAGNTATSSAVSVTVNNAAAGQPDLIVTNVTWSPPSPANGNQVTFSATVKNNGSAITPAGTIVGIAFEVDGQEVTWSDNITTQLNPGESRTQTANGGKQSVAYWPATSGSHTITAWVDDVNRIAESNETNNQMSVNLSVGSTSGVAGDVNGDGKVDVLDLSIMLSHWGAAYAAADLDHSGIVDAPDLSILLSNYK